MAGKLYWRIKKNGKWTWKAAPKMERFLEAEGTLWVYTDEGIELMEENIFWRNWNSADDPEEVE